MVESFNISVAAALVMYEAQQQRLRRLGRHADLDERQREALKAVMLAKTVVRKGTQRGVGEGRAGPHGSGSSEREAGQGRSEGLH